MSAAFAAFLVLSAVSPIAAAYVDNDVEYHFNIGTYQSNSRSTGRYRETTNTNNKWSMTMEIMFHLHIQYVLQMALSIILLGLQLVKAQYI